MSGLKPITCRAALMYDYKKPLVLETVTIDPPVDDQVRVKLVSTGICPSDAHVHAGLTKVTLLGQKLPLVLGHEGAGIVESVGKAVTSLKAGDRVLTNYATNCNDCKFCWDSKTNFCMKENFATLGSIANKKNSSGEAIPSFCGLGTFSEYVLVKQSQLVKIDSRVNLAHSAIITCGVCSGYYGATDQVKVTPKSTAAVWGVNSFGVSAIYGCKVNGATNIIAVDNDANKKEIALEFGATEFINVADNSLGEPLEQYLLKKYGGVDFAIDASGEPTWQNTALKSLSPHGTITYVAMSPEGTEVSISMWDLFGGKKIVGGLWGKKRAGDAYGEIVEMYRSGQMDLDRMITNKYKFEQINEAVQSVRDCKSVRSLVVF